MKCRFEVGQDVVCIKDNDWESLAGEKKNGPGKGEICRIADMYELWGHIYLRFKKWGIDGFESTCFRPLQKKSKETSIDIFKKILDKQNAKFEEQMIKYLEPMP